MLAEPKLRSSGGGVSPPASLSISIILFIAHRRSSASRSSSAEVSASVDLCIVFCSVAFPASSSSFSSPSKNEPYSISEGSVPSIHARTASSSSRALKDRHMAQSSARPSP
ncbi:hypothetical protein FALCPG4_001958 [Fusarium falciforme]